VYTNFPLFAFILDEYFTPDIAMIIIGLDWYPHLSLSHYNDEWVTV